MPLNLLPEVLGGTLLVDPSQKAILKLPAQDPGEYVLICTYPGHSAVMKAMLLVAP